eukprot:365243-Chlamydomonas_euryale.AAC.4
MEGGGTARVSDVLPVEGKRAGLSKSRVAWYMEGGGGNGVSDMWPGVWKGGAASVNGPGTHGVGAFEPPRVDAHAGATSVV